MKSACALASEMLLTAKLAFELAKESYELSGALANKAHEAAEMARALVGDDDVVAHVVKLACSIVDDAAMASAAVGDAADKMQVVALKVCGVASAAKAEKEKQELNCKKEKNLKATLDFAINQMTWFVRSLRNRGSSGYTDEEQVDGIRIVQFARDVDKLVDMLEQAAA